MQAAVWGVADTYVALVERLLERAKLADRQLTAGELAKAEAALRTAGRLDFLRPDLANARANIQLLRIQEAPVWEPEAKTAREQAAQRLRATLAARPTWPHTWADLAAVKFRLAQLDAEFFQALERAAALGPWEPAVQATVVDLGLAAWILLPESTREIVQATLERGLQHQATNMIDLAIRHQRVDLLETWADVDEAHARQIRARETVAGREHAPPSVARAKPRP